MKGRLAVFVGLVCSVSLSYVFASEDFLNTPEPDMLTNWPTDMPAYDETGCYPISRLEYLVAILNSYRSRAHPLKVSYELMRTAKLHIQDVQQYPYEGHPVYGWSGEWPAGVEGGRACSLHDNSDLYDDCIAPKPGNINNKTISGVVGSLTPKHLTYVHTYDRSIRSAIDSGDVYMMEIINNNKLKYVGLDNWSVRNWGFLSLYAAEEIEDVQLCYKNQAPNFPNRHPTPFPRYECHLSELAKKVVQHLNFIREYDADLPPMIHREELVETAEYHVQDLVFQDIALDRYCDTAFKNYAWSSQTPQNVEWEVCCPKNAEEAAWCTGSKVPVFAHDSIATEVVMNHPMEEEIVDDNGIVVTLESYKRDYNFLSALYNPKNRFIGAAVKQKYISFYVAETGSNAVCIDGVSVVI